MGAFSATTAGLRIVGAWDLYTYGTWSGTLHLERLNQAGGWDIVRSWRGNDLRNVITSGVEEQQATLRLRAVSMTGTAASGAAVPKFLLEAADANVIGLVRITDVTSTTVATAEVVTSLHAATATLTWTEGAFSELRGYPRTITLHQQRLWFAGTRAYPTGIWASVTSDIENFRRGVLDDSSLFFQLAAEEANTIQWITSYGQLLVGTNGEIWSAVGAGENQPITPVGVKFTQGGKFGSAYLPAVLVHEVPCFVERTGRKVRRVTYSGEDEKFIGSNLTVLSEHVTGEGIVQMAFAQQPNAILWAVTAGGELIGMTFENEQNVYGWHRHTTDGFFESVATVYGDEADEVWVTVRRTVDGEAERYVERLDPHTMRQVFDEPEQLVYLDSATVFEAPGTATLTGLVHLIGATVGIVADGAQLPSAVVSAAGELTIDSDAYARVTVGRPYTMTLQPWRQELQMAKGTAQGSAIKVSSVVLCLLESLGGEVADSATGRFDLIPYRTAGAAMDTSLDLFTGEKPIVLPSKHRPSVAVVVRSSHPFPFNVTGIVLKMDAYDS